MQRECGVRAAIDVKVFEASPAVNGSEDRSVYDGRHLWMTKAAAFIGRCIALQ